MQRKHFKGTSLSEMASSKNPAKTVFNAFGKRINYVEILDESHKILAFRDSNQKGLQAEKTSVGNDSLACNDCRILTLAIESEPCLG